ncbi:hypothetical protein CCACVL1_21183 [Corchorus capsularis]|uniref:DUF668 domain-containing protein n=1 Tax=Corchorus capsularis TaxID=210143 RepID=A0A1R3H7R4_COCAP|nr:hypothetical protein CCACVL1_21183 [Corchorus capsularis]
MPLASMAWIPNGVHEKSVSSGSKKCPIFGSHEKKLHSSSVSSSSSSSSSNPKLEILSFETAKAMSRLLALLRSLSDDEFAKLRSGPLKSPGVVFLNSDDESYLLGLACKEKLEDLNQAATVVSRLGKKCSDEELNRFDIAYHNMKQGVIDVNKIDYNSRNVAKTIEKMEKFANATAVLFAALIGLNELEGAEKKMQRWKRNDFQCNKNKSEKSNFDYFNEKISYQRKQVKHLRQVSLWNQTFDKTVGLMARIVCVVFVRICNLFEPFVPSLPRITRNRHFQTRVYVSDPRPALHMKIYPEANYCLLVNKEKTKKASKSGPIMKSSRIKFGKTARFHSCELSPEEKSGLRFRVSTVTITDKLSIKNNDGNYINGRKNQRLIQSAPPNTVGAAGLAIRYANVIAMAESYFVTTTTIKDEARERMFEMLPVSLKQTLRGKLKSHWNKDAEERDGQQGLAEGWKEALEEIIGWLAPMAHDTLRWQQERNLEQQKLDAKSTVLLLQTLHFSDLEKTEAAIVEVLVGLSCIYRYENRRERGGYWLL